MIRVIWMIRNEEQYEVTRSRVLDFERSVSALDSRLERDPDPLAELERDGLRGKLEDLRGEVAEYERLRSGGAGAAPCDLEDLPGTLVRTRISLGMSEQDAAERLGMDEREVLEYERTGYEGASYDAMMGILSALPAGGERTARGAAADFDGALERLSRAGLDRKFVADHILYEPDAAREDGGMREHSKPKLLARLEALFGWTSRQVLGGGPLAAGPPARDARGGAAGPWLLHAAYARGMARILGRAARRRGAAAGPAGLDGLRESMAGSPAPPTFARLVGRAWDSGVPVIRLGPLAFRSACFREGGSAVVVLSGGRVDETGLMLDLLRGVHCAASGGELVGGGRAPRAGIGAPDEFAYSVLLGDDADGMFRDCLARCAESGGGRNGLSALEDAAVRVAKREGARPDTLACYVVHRLVGGLATGRRSPVRGMQERVEDWPAIVSDAALARIDLSALGGSELALLTGAIRAGYGRRRSVQSAARGARGPAGAGAVAARPEAGARHGGVAHGSMRIGAP